MDFNASIGYMSTRPLRLEYPLATGLMSGLLRTCEQYCFVSSHLGWAGTSLEAPATMFILAGMATTAPANADDVLRKYGVGLAHKTIPHEPSRHQYTYKVLAADEVVLFI